MHSFKLWHRHTPTSAYAIWCATVEPAKATITHRLVAIAHSSGVKPSWWVMDCGHRRQRNREVRVQDPDRQLVGGGRFGRWQTASQIATWQLRKKLRFLSLPCTLSTMIIGSRRCVQLSKRKWFLLRKASPDRFADDRRYFAKSGAQKRADTQYFVQQRMRAWDWATPLQRLRHGRSLCRGKRCACACDFVRTRIGQEGP